ncbi:Nif3-like dinuclear metal center hexameric protein [Shewanella youngdeokensis]|uniref:Nif3-like dinuclear metal center hexameric protein n=1 Tax=Shewanella youngdeokensis TaxID=2999068 RepID=A0ABZ0JU08_9GAMM|nr:Nif3-like dinuclear metal center hexameric protein [Shewanella sp. DAU334]
MTRTELCQYLAQYLKIDTFKDYAPNGLQVEGTNEIKTIVTGVTACQALIDKAIELNADAIIVHHGFFWKSEPEIIVGMKQKRIKALLINDINLLGYHLPLDAHEDVGNNAQLGNIIGIDNARVIEGYAQGLMWRGELSVPSSAGELKQAISHALSRECLHLGNEQGLVETVAWCSGGAQDYIDIAASLGIDAFISGEVSERTYHCAVEQNIQYYAAGHHATELYGIQALGKHLADKFELTHHFVDISNPV